MTRKQIEQKLNQYEAIKKWYLDNPKEWRVEDYKRFDQLCDVIMGFKRMLIFYRGE